jgi:hypothetical protein
MGTKAKLPVCSIADGFAVFGFALIILMPIKDADCDLVVGIMSRAFPAKDAGCQLQMQRLRPPEVWWPFLSGSALGYVRRLFVGLLALLSQPTMLLNPFLSFGSGKKVAEVARIVSWPRHFDAPMVPLHDRS